MTTFCNEFVLQKLQRTVVLSHILTIFWRSAQIKLSRAHPHHPAQHHNTTLLYNSTTGTATAASWYSNKWESSWIATCYFLTTWFRNLQPAAVRDCNTITLQHPCASTITVPSTTFFSNSLLSRCCEEVVRGIRGRQDVSRRGWIQRCAAWWFTWMGETFREKKWRPTVWEMKDKDAARSARSDMGSFASRWMDVVSVTLLLIYSFATWMFRLSCFLRIPIFPMQW